MKLKLKELKPMIMYSLKVQADKSIEDQSNKNIRFKLGDIFWLPATYSLGRRVWSYTHNTLHEYLK